jgi:hypothetical protein
MSAEAAAQLGPVSTYVRQWIARLLDEHRVVVWYDGEQAFGELVRRLELPHTTIVSASISELQARRQADAVYRQLDEPECGEQGRGNLLIYVPRARGSTIEQWLQDPFEAFARCGHSFGDDEAEELLSLAQPALPDQRLQISRLFRDGRPPLDLLDRLSTGEHYPLLRQALGTDAPAEAIVRALSRSEAHDQLQGVPGALREFSRLAETEFGLAPRSREQWPAFRRRMAQYLLIAELAADLPNGLPSDLAGVPRADGPRTELALDVSDRLRDSDAGRDAYIALADDTEQSLRLSALLSSDTVLGARDTFRRQDQLRLALVAKAAMSADLPTARALLERGERSIWRRDTERALIWQVA